MVVYVFDKQTWEDIAEKVSDLPYNRRDLYWKIDAIINQYAKGDLIKLEFDENFAPELCGIADSMLWITNVSFRLLQCIKIVPAVFILLLLLKYLYLHR